jgi:hypothetical protein
MEKTIGKIIAVVMRVKGKSADKWNRRHKYVESNASAATMTDLALTTKNSFFNLITYQVSSYNLA